MINKPFSQACENNKQAILQKIKIVYQRPVTVWEIGSGTGQHACYFAQNLPHCRWQASDREENLPGINSWVESANLVNLAKPLPLNVNDSLWPCQTIEALFTANTLHIMHWTEVESLFVRLARYLAAGADVCIYGPFNYHGDYTSASNRQFDLWLKQRDPFSGIRDIESVVELAAAAGLIVQQDYAMPANNRLLVLKNGCNDKF